METNDLITVIIPVYNVEKYLSKCVDSVCQQTYTNLEILLINDGSTDSSGELCDKLAETDARIRVIHQKNGGASCARNRGIANASGKYLAFMDSDDYAELDMIEYLYSLIQKFHCQMSLCGCIVVKHGKEFGHRGDAEFTVPAHDAVESMLYQRAPIDVSASAKLFERSLFEKIRFPEGKLFEDAGTLYKLYMASGIMACGLQSKYYYFIRENSITTGAFSRAKLDMLEITDQMGMDVLKVYPDLAKGVLRRRVYARFSTLNRMILRGGGESFAAERKEMIDFIKKNAFSVLLDSNAPKRDKAAIISLLLSDRLYAFLWRKYAGIR